MRPSSFFTAITSEGGLLPADFLVELLAPKSNIEGLEPTSYNLAEGERTNEQVNRSWNRLKGRWADFKKAIADKQPGDSTTTETRDRWLQPLFQELGYGQRLPLARPIEADGRSYPVSHGWSYVPIHLVGSHIDLDRRTPGAVGAAKASPHSLVQQVLNVSGGHLWGIVSNGLTFRLLRDSVALTRMSYVEWDLAAIFDGDLYSEFFVLWLVAHQSRFDAERAEQCWLEKWKKSAEDKGLRALENLRPGVARAIEALGAGLVSHPTNRALRTKLSRGELSTQDFYRQVLRVIYRMLFLFVAEDRDLLHQPLPEAEATKEENEKALRARRRYRDFYAVTRLRGLTLQRAGTPHPDLWHIFQLLTQMLGSDTGCPELALPALGSFLWDATRSTPDLIGGLVSNRHFLAAVHALAFVEDGSVRRPIDYKNLGSEELGSVYEGLLALHPLINADTGTFELNTATGNERKTSGSYYTPDSLVQSLLDSALEPVMAEAVRGKQGQAAVDALLKLKVCDPAVGSGHFLIAAAHRLAKKVASARSGEDEPSPETTRSALRDVIGRCLYGVDINPMAAELCRVSLWLEALDPGKPLSFLDHHIRVGNSLLGATPGLIAAGLPDEAFTPIEGDDKKACAVLRKRNKAESKRLGPLFAQQDAETQARLQQAAAALEELRDDRPEDIRAKELAFRHHEQTEEYHHKKRLADAWCAAFVIRKDLREPGRETTASGITQGHLNDLADGRTLPSDLAAKVERLSDQYKFFHWHLAFPEVFGQGGFDCVLGNPPWEVVSAEEQEFFSARDPSIVAVPTRSKRLLAIEALKESNPSLFEEWVAYRQRSIATAGFFHSSHLYPLTGNGNLNSYLLFTERSRKLVGTGGRVGLILPSAVASGESSKELFQDLIDSNALVCLFDFENRDQLFLDIDSRMKFCLMVTADHRSGHHSVSLAFNLKNIGELLDSDRRVTLSPSDFLVLNPNTRTAATFTSRHDANLVFFLHRIHPVLRNETVLPLERPWRVECMRMVDLSYDSEHFSSEQEIVANGYEGMLDYYQKGRGRFLPVYEAKMTQQYDHRAADVVISKTAQIRSAQQESLSPEEHNDPDRFPRPRFWMPEAVAFRAIPEWYGKPYLLAYTLVTSPTNHRTLLASFMPKRPAGHSLRLIYCRSTTVHEPSFLLAGLNSFACDYICRNKIGGVNLNPVITYQLPVPHPRHLVNTCRWGHGPLESWITVRVLELTYTAWDIERFAQDCGWSGPPFRWDEERRFLLRCELDAAFFHLYLSAEINGEWHGAEGEPPEDLARIKARFPTPRDAVAYIMDTFPIVRRKDEGRYDGDYRTKRVILEIYDAMQVSIRTGTTYQTRLDPPPADPLVAHPRLKIGLLAFGSLIDDPGEEINSRTNMRIRTTTPFPVEFGRYSGRTRGGAPTLVRHEAGEPIPAEILVLDDSVSFDEARDMLWRRERRKIGSCEKYVEGTSKDSVLVREFTESLSVALVLYTDFSPEGKIEQPNAAELAAQAIDSVRKADAGMDGIIYLMNAMAAGIRTPLTEAFSEEILRQSGTNSLQEALERLRPK